MQLRVTIAKVESSQRPRNVMTMIDWNAEDWGNNVHLSANGSWVPDRHDDESTQ